MRRAGLHDHACACWKAGDIPDCGWGPVVCFRSAGGRERGDGRWLSVGQYFGLCRHAHPKTGVEYFQQCCERLHDAVGEVGT